MRRTTRWAGLLLAATIAITSGGLYAAGQPVDLNRASVEELIALPGIGKAKAEAIVAYRTTAPFKTAQDLIKVPGIGEKLFERLSAQVTVEGGAAPARVTAK